MGPKIIVDVASVGYEELWFVRLCFGYVAVDKCGYVDWIGLAQDRERWRTLVSAVMNLRVP